MPVILSTLVILVAATGCWLLSVLFIRILFRPYSPKDIAGFRLHGIVPAVMPGIARYASDLVQHEMLSPEKIAARLDDPQLMQQLRPEIETHIDQFLQTKLKEAFPLLSNFMGEKTLGKFKAAFLTEVETILPDLLKKNAGKLLEDWQPAGILADKIKRLDMAAIEKSVQLEAGRQIRSFQLAAFMTGIVLGTVQVILIHLY